MIQVGEPILWILEKEGPEMLEDDQEEPQPSTEAVTSSFLLSPENSFSVLQTTGGSAISPEGRSMPETKQKLSSVDVVAAQEQGMGDSSVPSAFKKVLTSPAVRKLARDHGIDLSTVTGTGPAGRISKGDVLAIAKISVPYTEMEDSSVSSKQSTTTNTIGISKNVEEWNRPLEEDTMVPLRGYNRIMADTMTASLQIPHMVYSDEINLNRFVGYKMEQQQLDSQNRLGENSKKLLFLPLAIKAVSKALEEYPWLNASYDDANHEATLWKDHNIGIAMDTPRGLIVPVIKECQNKSLPELAEDLTRLKASVMEGGGGLAATDLKDATFTLSNVGAIGGGGTYMSPIITPPQVAIGALGQIRRLPRFVAPSSTDPTQSQTIEEAHICAVSWAADHRIVDGATVARFHKSFKEYMEDPIKLLLELR
jgi:2-oxoisovalerate dehydrogenase E2 component (dihydrolipoyl transacylase)